MVVVVVVEEKEEDLTNGLNSVGATRGCYMYTERARARARLYMLHTFTQQLRWLVVGAGSLDVGAGESGCIKRGVRSQNPLKYRLFSAISTHSARFISEIHL